MRFHRPAVIATLAASAFIVSSRGATIAATTPSIYAFASPDHYVEYLVLDRVGDQARGYFSIDRSDESTDGAKLTRIVSQKAVGDCLLFGEYSAQRTAEGFQVSSAAADGRVTQQRLSRTTPDRLNALLAALALSSRRNRAMSDLRAAKAELRGRGDVAQAPLSRLSQAQSRLDAATAVARDTQAKADSLWHDANDLRGVADAELTASSVNLVENDRLKIAMDRADQAERKARFEQRLATIASSDAATAESDLIAARRWITALQERVAAASAILKGTGNLADR